MITILIISILISLIFAPLGCLVLWKNYVYFGDGLAHASILAAVISVIAGIPILYIAIINCLFFAIIIFKLKKRSGNNASIGFVSSSMTSLALILTYIFPENFNFSSLLFGDIITTNSDDIFILSLILSSVIIFLISTYKNLLLIILSKDIAHSRGIKVNLIEFLFLSILSFAVIGTVKIVGALLVTSIILIPAMIAKLLSNSPLKMIIIAILTAQLMNLCGIILSFYMDLPLSPIIILCGSIIYISCLIFNKFYNNTNLYK